MTIPLARRAGAALAVALALGGCQPGAGVPTSVAASAAPALLPVASPAPAASPAGSPGATAYEAPRMTPEEAQAAIARGEAIVFVDVRFKENYTLERIAGAVSAPWGELEAGHAMLPKEKLLLLYCT